MLFKMCTGDWGLIFKIVMNSKREELQNNMFAAHKEQKKLLKQRDVLLNNGESDELLQITHRIAKLEDFIKMAENNLKMSD